MLRWKIFRSKWIAICWFIIMCVLFFLPGSALPQSTWLEKVQFDKIVHIGLFAILIFLWRSSFNSEIKNYNWLILLLALIFGIIVELIQGQWIPNRSCDIFDVAADMTGSILGLMVWVRVYKKNKPL